MRIRTKLTAYFLIIALLVPILGGAALTRIRSIDDSVGALSEEAVPRQRLAEKLARTQREQQAAALSYVGSGKREDRQRYLDLTQVYSEDLARLKAMDSTTGGNKLLKGIETQRASFLTNGATMLKSRETVDTNVVNLTTRTAEMVDSLNSIRRRFVPRAGDDPTDLSKIPLSLRQQVNDLLLGTEGMLRQVSTAFQIGTAYTIAPSDQLKEQLDTTGELFNASFGIAQTAAGPDDKVILGEVQTKFRTFESSVRAMINAGDIASRSRTTFSESSDKISADLNTYVDFQTQLVNAAREDSAGTVGGAETMIFVITFAGVAFACIVGFLFARSITRPIEQLRVVADRVSQGDVEDIEINVKSGDEIADLAESFRRMVASIRYFMHPQAEDVVDDSSPFDFPVAS